MTSTDFGNTTPTRNHRVNIAASGIASYELLPPGDDVIRVDLHEVMSPRPGRQNGARVAQHRPDRWRTSAAQCSVCATELSLASITGTVADQAQPSTKADSRVVTILQQPQHNSPELNLPLAGADGAITFGKAERI